MPRCPGNRASVSSSWRSGRSFSGTVQPDVRPVEAVRRSTRGWRSLKSCEVMSSRVTRSRGGGEARDAGTRVSGPGRLAQIAVVRAEIVAPLAHAMNLVDDDLHDRQPVERRLQALGAQQLRREIEQLEALLLDRLPDPGALAPIHAAVHGGGLDAEQP
jgi:hypothetical protein